MALVCFNDKNQQDVLRVSALKVMQTFALTVSRGLLPALHLVHVGLFLFSKMWHV